MRSKSPNVDVSQSSSFSPTFPGFFASRLQALSQLLKNQNRRKIEMKKNIFLTIFIWILVIVFSMNLFSFVRSNGSGKGYDDDGGEGQGLGIPMQSNKQIDLYVTEGASHFLKAKKNIQQILDMVEMQDIQGLDFNALDWFVDSAIWHMTNALETYEKLIGKAEVTPYNQDIQAWLKEFDYDYFMLENGLNISVFEEVKGFLQQGDITGVFRRTYSRDTEILEMLISIKIEISGEKLPGLSIFWRLNETCDLSSLFGSYIARVFNETP
jgi:hypothetical protein